jgi:hypothetical protein
VQSILFVVALLLFNSHKVFFFLVAFFGDLSTKRSLESKKLLAED